MRDEELPPLHGAGRKEGREAAEAPAPRAGGFCWGEAAEDWEGKGKEEGSQGTRSPLRWEGGRQPASQPASRGRSGSARPRGPRKGKSERGRTCGPCPRVDGPKRVWCRLLLRPFLSSSKASKKTSDALPGSAARLLLRLRLRQLSWAQRRSFPSSVPGFLQLRWGRWSRLLRERAERRARGTQRLHPFSVSTTEGGREGDLAAPALLLSPCQTGCVHGRVRVCAFYSVWPEQERKKEKESLFFLPLASLGRSFPTIQYRSLRCYDP